jgi:hypothetical protein
VPPLKLRRHADGADAIRHLPEELAEKVEVSAFFRNFVLMKKVTAILMGIGIFLACFLSCQKIESISEIPYIEFKSFDLKDTIDILGNEVKIGELVFKFEDGDGNIGVGQADSLYPDTTNYNLFFTLFEKIDGQFQLVDEDDLETSLNYRIPYIENVGQNKTLKGEIKVDFYYLLMLYDTIKYEFYILDRADNKSNVETTREISFDE